MSDLALPPSAATRSRRAWLCGVAMATGLAACTGTAPVVVPSAPPPPIKLTPLQQQVYDTEAAFAKTMADRDHAAFTRFLADDCVFFTGTKPLHGKAAVAAAWRPFYKDRRAPFSWRPDKVEVLDDGSLAISSGPVFDDTGKAIASFTSIWRQVSPGVWRIVFDKGCNCP